MSRTRPYNTILRAYKLPNFSMKPLRRAPLCTCLNMPSHRRLPTSPCYGGHANSTIHALLRPWKRSFLRWLSSNRNGWRNITPEQNKQPEPFHTGSRLGSGRSSAQRMWRPSVISPKGWSCSRLCQTHQSVYSKNSHYTWPSARRLCCSKGLPRLTWSVPMPTPLHWPSNLGRHRNTSRCSWGCAECIFLRPDCIRLARWQYNAWPWLSTCKTRLPYRKPTSLWGQLAFIWVNCIQRESI